MSANLSKISLRTKKLGVLIRDARQKTAKTIDESAKAVGVSSDRFESFEYGENSPSFPELELIAKSFSVPLEHFWGNKLLINRNKSMPDIDTRKSLHQKRIGTIIRTTRNNLGLSLEILSNKTGISIENLSASELGDRAIGIPELEIIAQTMDISMLEFQERQIEDDQGILVQKYSDQFMLLPKELKEFIGKSINRPYLDLAMQLSEMPAEKLRSIAEGLLAITF